jgi:hypothetical protein
MIACPLLPNLSAETPGGIQNGIADIGTRAPILPRLGILASRDSRLCAAPGNGLVTAFRVIGTVAADARDGLAPCNLVEQVWQSVLTDGSTLEPRTSPAGTSRWQTLADALVASPLNPQRMSMKPAAIQIHYCGIHSMSYPSRHWQWK